MAAVDDIVIEQPYRELLAAAGLSGEGVFSDPRVRVWRDLPERQNAIFEFTSPDGHSRRWHVKRYLAGHAHELAAEVQGIRLLQSHGIATVPLVAHGRLGGGRAFLVSDDLAGYLAGDKLPTARLLESLDAVIELAVKLHSEGLHHRDLYLCHFFVPVAAPGMPRLIDAGRVAKLPSNLLRWRWIIKDVAQLLYSLRTAGIEEQSQCVLGAYCRQQRLRHPGLFGWLVRCKVAAIARHDRRTRLRRPTRNVSLDSSQS